MQINQEEKRLDLTFINRFEGIFLLFHIIRIHQLKLSLIFISGHKQGTEQRLHSISKFRDSIFSIEGSEGAHCGFTMTTRLYRFVYRDWLNRQRVVETRETRFEFEIERDGEVNIQHRTPGDNLIGINSFQRSGFSQLSLVYVLVTY